MTEITCIYNRTAEGRRLLNFAADLWRRLQCATPLNVAIVEDVGTTALMTTHKSESRASELALIGSDVLLKTGLADASVRLSDRIEAELSAAELKLIVDQNLAFRRDDLSILYPARELSLLERGDGPILVPFGDGTSVLPAAAAAFELAAGLSLPVVLYHTTWVDPTVHSPAPPDHMCLSANSIHAQLLVQAAAMGVTVHSVIETADDVVEVLLNCAMRESACLIVMSRSAKTRIGCYVSQTLTKTPVPLLALASKRRKAA